MADTNGDESIEMKHREIADLSSTALVHALNGCGDLPGGGEVWEKQVHAAFDDRVYVVTVREQMHDPLERIAKRATMIVNETIFDLATPEELDQGRFQRLSDMAENAVSEAVDRASTGDADDLTVEGFIAG